MARAAACSPRACVMRRGLWIVCVPTLIECARIPNNARACARAFKNVIRVTQDVMTHHTCSPVLAQDLDADERCASAPAKDPAQDTRRSSVLARDLDTNTRCVAAPARSPARDTRGLATLAQDPTTHIRGSSVWPQDPDTNTRSSAASRGHPATATRRSSAVAREPARATAALARASLAPSLLEAQHGSASQHEPSRNQKGKGT